jgi:hypothetical protein
MNPGDRRSVIDRCGSDHPEQSIAGDRYNTGTGAYTNTQAWTQPD